MRWLDKTPENGATRIIRIFLLFPRTINFETHWLEMAHIRQKFMRFRDTKWGHHNGIWQDEGWEDGK